MASDSVQIEVVIQNTGVPREGFGTTITLSHNSTAPTLVTAYADSSEAADDWPAGTPEKLAVDALFDQDPHPLQTLIGKVPLAITQSYLITADQIVNSFDYELGVSGTGFVEEVATYTSGVAATAAAILAGLRTALDAVADNNYSTSFPALVITDKVFTADNATETFSSAAHGMQTGQGPVQVANSGGALPAGLAAAADYYVIRTGADTFQLASSLANALAGTPVAISTNGTGTQTLSDTLSTVNPAAGIIVTVDAGEFLSLEIQNLRLLSIKETTVPPAGLADALDDLLDEDPSFYAVNVLYTSAAYIKVVADWAQANKRLFVFTTSDTDVIKTTYVPTVTTDVGSKARDAGYTYVMGGYHPRPSAMFAAAWMGRWLPTDPGKAIARYKTLVGPEVVGLKTSWKNNLLARRMQTYAREYQRDHTTGGMVFSTVYLYVDVRRNVDWFVDMMGGRIFGLLVGSDIIPYTPEGRAQVEGEAEGGLTEAEDQGVFGKGTTKVLVTPFESIPVSDKTARNLRSLGVVGTLAGAIETVIPLKATILF